MKFAIEDSRLAALVESSEDAIIGKTLDGTIVSWNPGAEHIYGYRAEEVLGQPVSILMSPDYPNEMLQILERLKRGELISPYETVRVRKDGTQINVSITVSPIKNAEGQAIGASSIARDITERKKNERRILNLNRSLEHTVNELVASNKELEAFSYSVSHDLRAPLRTIDGFSQAILEDYSDILDEDGKDSLERIRKGCQDMGQLINDMLKLARITRGDIRREIVDLSGMVQEIASELQQQHPEREVQFIIAQGVVASADPQMLRMVFDNLLGNAWKFTSKRSRVKIEFGITQYNGKPAYFVRDNGAGFDMTYASKLFGAFQRLHSTTEFPGTGIGLAIVQRIIQRHGGSVSAHAEVDKGATFYITL